METRQQAIIQELLKYETPLSGSHLAHLNNVTSRTIREDVREINEIIGTLGGTIRPVMGKGYELDILDSDIFKLFLQSLNEGERSVAYTHEERTSNIICSLLLSSKYIKMDDLADELFISKSTLQSDMKQVKAILSDYHLEIVSKPGYGIKVSGTEMNLRFCLSQYIFNHTHYKTEPHSIYLNNDELEKIQQVVTSTLKTDKITITDIAIKNLVIHIGIAVRRIRDGYSVDGNSERLIKFKNHKEYDIAERIALQCETLFDVSFPPHEAEYISLHLAGTKIVRENNDVEQSYDMELQRVVDDALKQVDEEYKMKTQKDKELRLSLLLHLKPAINRYRCNMNVRNPMLEDIGKHYPLAFEIAMFAGRIIEKSTATKLDENEIGYIALHIGGAIERSKLRKCPKKCIVVCASGAGTSKLIYYRLKNHFGNALNILDEIQYYKLEDYPLYSLDFIISALPITLDIDIPVIEVNAIMTDKDIKNIEKFIIRNEQKNFYEYINEELVFINKNLTSRAEVLSFFDNILRDQKLVDENFLESVYERENVMATSFGNLIAIPHPVQPMSVNTFLSFMSLEKPVLWGENNAQLICMLCVKKGSQEDLEIIYDRLRNIIEDPDKVKELLNCGTSTEFLRKINS